MTMASYIYICTYGHLRHRLSLDLACVLAAIEPVVGVAYASVRVRPRLQNGDVAGAQPREAKGRLQWASEEDDCLEAEKQQEGGR